MSHPPWLPPRYREPNYLDYQHPGHIRLARPIADRLAQEMVYNAVHEREPAMPMDVPPRNGTPLARIMAGGIFDQDDEVHVRECCALRQTIRPRDRAERAQVDLFLLGAHQMRSLIRAIEERPIGDPVISRAQKDALQLMTKANQAFEVLQKRKIRQREKSSAEIVTEVEEIMRKCADDNDTPDPNWRERFELPKGEAIRHDDMASWPRLKGGSNLTLDIISIHLDTWSLAAIYYYYPYLEPADMRAIRGCIAEEKIGPVPHYIEGRDKIDWLVAKGQIKTYENDLSGKPPP